ncbi:MAG: topoisomerase C-terminal repeat-containing protein [Clostridia bacterium]|nr:topoisomerase C-terminal repeat-containing protein [Clostridia bacterium]
MIVIIAEKPSLARNIVAGIGEMTKKKGYYENSEYFVTWAFGHLFSLCDVEDYTGEPANKKWSLDNLPCFPDKFKFKLKKGADGLTDKGSKEQFEIIKSLLNRADVDTVVNAGDSDREGEIIIRLCVNHALTTKKRFLRLWLPDQTPKTVKKALSEMKDEEHYQNLANEGFSRTYIDWLYGVNLTRYATLKSGSLLRVGRVIVPIVKAIYDRDKEIENFVPEIYYALVSKAKTKGELIELTSQYKFSKDEKHKAEICCERMNKLDAVVTDKKAKKEILNPGKLYSLTKLQNYLGKKYKMPMERSLAIAQKLYENGYISYPRTNSEYLATNEKSKIKEILAGVKSLGYPVIFKDKKNIFDDSKIESHSALTPTYKIPKKEALTEEESKVYTAILRRFVAVFCEEECVIEKSEITISLGGKEDYLLKGSIVITPGWTKFDGGDRKDKILPNLNLGDKINIDFHPEEKQTQPPKHYTIETLNNYLKNPFKDEKASDGENDDEDYKAIFKGLELGTEATRTGIIDNAKKSGYISLNKDVYKIERGGRFLIEQLVEMNISMDKYKTSQLGQALKKVYRGEITIEDSVKIAQDEINEVFALKDKESNGFYGEKIGTCPICGKDVVRGRFAYGCMGAKTDCPLKINFKILGATVTVEQAKKLLSDGFTDKLKFISKTGKEFESKLKLEKDGKVVFDFENKA